MAATRDGGGYWLVARPTAGSSPTATPGSSDPTGSSTLNQPIVGMAATPDGGGYWLVARDGGIFTYGDAGFSGSPAAAPYNAPVVGMAANGAGGYWLVASDGGTSQLRLTVLRERRLDASCRVPTGSRRPRAPRELPATGVAPSTQETHASPHPSVRPIRARRPARPGRRVARRLLRDVPDFPTPGVVFKDITLLLADAPGFDLVVTALVAPFLGRVDKVAAIEARGFILGAPAAVALGAGLVPLRKPGKLPWETLSESYELEYGIDALEIHTDALAPGDRVLLVDDVIATGGTARAAAALVATAGARPGGPGGAARARAPRRSPPALRDPAPRGHPLTRRPLTRIHPGSGCDRRLWSTERLACRGRTRTAAPASQVVRRRRRRCSPCCWW